MPSGQRYSITFYVVFNDEEIAVTYNADYCDSIVNHVAIYAQKLSTMIPDVIILDVLVKFNCFTCGETKENGSGHHECRKTNDLTTGGTNDA